MPKQTHAQQLATRFAKLGYNDIAPASRHAVKRLLLDYLGVALAGSQSESGVIARRFARGCSRAGSTPTNASSENCWNPRSRSSR